MENKTKSKRKTSPKRKPGRKKTNLTEEHKIKNEVDRESEEKIAGSGRKTDVLEEETEGECFAKWTAPEYIVTKEEDFLYKGGMVACAFMVIWSFLQGNYVVTVAFLLAIVVIALHLFSEPRDIEYQINIDGIIIGDRLYDYKNIQSFEVDADFDLLKFKSKNAFFPIKEIYIADHDPLYIRAVLENFLFEEKQEATLVSYKKNGDFNKEEMSDEEFYKYLKEAEKDFKREEV